MERLLITSPLPVTLNNYTKSRIIWIGKDEKKKKPMVSVYETSEAKRFKKEFIKLFIDSVEKQGWETEPNRDDFYVVHATWYFDKQNRDSNNMWKIMLDAITDTQLVWIDDRQTIERTVRIYYDTQNPRVELEIFKAKWVGIFNSPEQHNEFILNNCALCSKNIESCSIYKNAIESRIKPDEIDIKSGECLKIKIPKSKKKLRYEVRREISTTTINSDIQKISNSANISDGFNAFDDLYMTALAFVHITLTNNKNIHLYINTYPTFFEVRLFDDDAMFPEWDMKFPLRYLNSILKFTP